MAAAYDWLVANPDVAAAVATILLTVFAAIQIGLEVSRRAERVRSAAIEAEGPAWLARRTLEAAMRAATSADTCFGWASGLDAEPLNRLERQMLDTLRLGSAAGGKYAASARVAFEAFVGFTDRVNSLAATRPSDTSGYGAPVYNDSEHAEANRLFGEAFDHAGSAVAALSEIAPRQRHEDALPKRSEVKALGAEPPP